MLKNILIISVIILLLATISNITPIKAQTFDSKLDVKEYTKSQDNDDDYHRTVNEQFVINTMQFLYEAEAEYIKSSGNGYFGYLDSLAEAGLIDEVLRTGEKYGYIFTVSVRQPQGGISAGFFVNARPRTYNRTGKRSFYMDATCLIRGDDKGGIDADVTDPIVKVCSPTIAFELENQMILGIRNLHAAQATYQSTYGNGNYGTFEELLEAGFIDYDISYYWYLWLEMNVTPPNKNDPARFEIYATPQVYRETGIRSFYMNESGILRGADNEGEPADENSPPIVFENEELIKFVMRSLATAQFYYARNPQIGGGNYAESFNELYKLRLIDFDLTSGTYGGYRFKMVVVNNEEPYFHDYQITATPINYGKGSIRSFYIDKANPLRGADRGGQTADENAPIVEF